MDSLTHKEILSILSDIGRTLPPAAELPDDALKKRLRQALNATQCINTLFPADSDRVPLNPSALPEWPAGETGDASVYASMRRVNFFEAGLQYQARLQGKQNYVESFTNAVVDMCQTIMAVASTWDGGRKWCLIQNPDYEQHAINVRLLGVYGLDDQTPLILMMYRSFTKDEASEGFAWLEDRMMHDPSSTVWNIKATVLEQKLILKVLAMNAKLLSPTYQPPRLLTEHTFHVSFRLPMGPLSFEDIGKLNNDTGCVICECQRADWRSHKLTCRSLKGGNWRTVPFTKEIPDSEGMMSVRFNRFDVPEVLCDQPITKVTGTEPPPANDHGSNAFLLKIQMPISDNGPLSMMLYDRQHTTDGFFSRRDVPEVFDELVREARGPRGGYQGLKIYRWARRVDDWKLSICVDRAPQSEIKW